MRGVTLDLDDVSSKGMKLLTYMFSEFFSNYFIFSPPANLISNLFCHSSAGAHHFDLVHPEQ